MPDVPFIVPFEQDGADEPVAGAPPLHLTDYINGMPCLASLASDKNQSLI